LVTEVPAHLSVANARNQPMHMTKWVAGHMQCRGREQQVKTIRG